MAAALREFLMCAARAVPPARECSQVSPRARPPKCPASPWCTAVLKEQTGPAPVLGEH